MYSADFSVPSLCYLPKRVELEPFPCSETEYILSTSARLCTSADQMHIVGILCDLSCGKLIPDRLDSGMNFAPHHTQTSIWEINLFRLKSSMCNHSKNPPL